MLVALFLSFVIFLALIVIITRSFALLSLVRYYSLSFIIIRSLFTLFSFVSFYSLFALLYLCLSLSFCFIIVLTYSRSSSFYRSSLVSLFYYSLSFIIVSYYYSLLTSLLFYSQLWFLLLFSLVIILSLIARPLLFASFTDRMKIINRYSLFYQSLSLLPFIRSISALLYYLRYLLSIASLAILSLGAIFIALYYSLFSYRFYLLYCYHRSFIVILLPLIAILSLLFTSVRSIF